MNTVQTPTQFFSMMFIESVLGRAVLMPFKMCGFAHSPLDNQKIGKDDFIN